MKKSQVLAALALAFALGVVAPVTGIIDATSVSAYSDEDGTATLSDVNNSIAFVENDATYKAYLKLQAANTAYTAGVANGTISDLTSTDWSDILTEIQSANAVFGYNTAAINKSITEANKYSDKVKNAIDGAKTSELYNALAGVLAVLNDNKATDAQLVKAATKVRTTVGWHDGTTTVGMGLLDKTEYDNLHPEEAKLVNYRGDGNPYKNWGTYTNAKDIYAEVVKGEEAFTKYFNGYNLYMPFLVESGLMTQDAIDIVNGKADLEPSYLNGVATTAANFNRMAQLGSLYTAVQNAKADRVQANSGDNYSIIGKLAKAWKDATGNEEAIKIVMARMAGYKAPGNGTGDGNNNNDGDGDGNKAPDTGVLASAEGSASTTVAMVAGIATALTAAGAGVVAYRNARRSTRK